MSFTTLGLHTALARRCESLGYTEPTPIQKGAIPLILGGSDLIGCAETGTGKTAAFLLPIIQRIAETPGGGVRVLILAPTRELAAQIEASYCELNPKKNIQSVTISGGASMTKQLAALRRRETNFVIATPGRLLDLMERRVIDLAHVEVLVLDEADRMLDMGFWPAIRRIIGELPTVRQTLLFSATMPPPIEEIARTTMRRPKMIEVGPRGQAARTVAQTAYAVAMDSKTTLLLDLLERERFERVLVFTRTRRGAERLSHILAAREHKVDRIHADRSQPQREAALRGFKSGNTRVLVATDIAARGIDVDSISHVINYDVPTVPEDYVHRIGRTGRAGNQGCAITLVTPVEELRMRDIERLTGERVQRLVLPALGGAVGALSSTPTTAAAVFKHGAGSVGSNVGGSVRSSIGSSVGRRSFRPRRASR